MRSRAAGCRRGGRWLSRACVITIERVLRDSIFHMYMYVQASASVQL